MENYLRKKSTGIFQNANWQELNDFFREAHDPLSLRKFRGYVKSATISEWAHGHWMNSDDEKGFGELMVLYAGKEWHNFSIRFYDSSDIKRFLILDINCDDNKIVLTGSLDNKGKLNDAFEGIISILDVKQIKNMKEFRFYDKWWFKRIIAPILVLVVGGLILSYFQNKSSIGKKNHFQGASVNGINNSKISGDVVGRDKIIVQNIINEKTDKKDIMEGMLQEFDFAKKDSDIKHQQEMKYLEDIYKNTGTNDIQIESFRDANLKNNVKILNLPDEPITFIFFALNNAPVKNSIMITSNLGVPSFSSYRIVSNIVILKTDIPQTEVFKNGNFFDVRYIKDVSSNEKLNTLENMEFRSEGDQYYYSFHQR